jgi:hypothetical protein
LNFGGVSTARYRYRTPAVTAVTAWRVERGRIGCGRGSDEYVHGAGRPLLLACVLSPGQWTGMKEGEERWDMEST